MYHDFTDSEIATLYKKAINCEVKWINTQTSKDPLESEDDWKSRIKNAVEHLETMKTHKKADKTTSIWTTEDFTAIDAAITAGKARIA